MSEYWLRPDHPPMLCDGHKGRLSHICLVRIEVRRLILASILKYTTPLASCVSDIIHSMPWNDPVAVRSEINDAADDWVAAGYITYEETENIHDHIKSTFKLNHDHYDILIGQYEKCPRQYAIKNWNWCRVCNEHLEIPNLDLVTCRSVYSFAKSQPITSWAIEVYDHQGTTIFITGVPTKALDNPISILAVHNKIK